MTHVSASTFKSFGEAIVWLQIFADTGMAIDPPPEAGADVLAGQIAEALALADKLELHLVSARLSEALETLRARD